MLERNKSNKQNINSCRRIMKNLTKFFLCLLIFTSTISAGTAETTVHGKLYAGWKIDRSTFSNGDNAFNISRAYMTIKSKLDSATSLRITTDVRSLDSFDGYSVILKYAYIDWNTGGGTGKLKIRFGLQPTSYIDKMNKLWGRRYLEKTVGDKNKFLTTSDLGGGFIFSIGEKGKNGIIALQILNGTSYTNVEEENEYKDFSAFLQLVPFANSEILKGSKIQAQFYNGVQNIDVTGSLTASDFKNDLLSAGGLLVYKKRLYIGGDLNFISRGPGNSTEADLKSSAISIFGTFKFIKITSESSPLNYFNIFGRYDIYDPNTDAINDQEKLLIAGVEYVPTKGFKVSLNLRNLSYEDIEVFSKSYIGLNALFKF